MSGTNEVFFTAAAELARISVEAAQALSLILLAQSFNSSKWPNYCKIQEGDTFDYIVVGAGSAGSIVANRLSERKQFKVLLIEAGGDPKIYHEVPGLTTFLQNNDEDWKFYTVNDNFSSQALENGRLAYKGGKMLGGSSNTNFMFYVRGNPDDFDNWSKMGFKNWDYKSLIPYFKKIEGFHSNGSVEDKRKHSHYGKTGPVLISKPKRNSLEETKLNNILVSLAEIGIPLKNDYNNGENQIGASRFAFTHSNAPGRRSSTAKAYLELIKYRKNVCVVRNSFVTKVIIKNAKAFGVEVLVGDKNLTVYSNQEIILSAGSINSPKILFNSGIGPIDLLKSLNIETLIDLPVGQNMQDHIFVPFVITGANISSGTQTYMPTVAADYINFPVSSAFITNEIHSTVPDLQLIPMYFGSTSPIFNQICQGLGFSKKVCYSISNTNLENEIYFIAVVLLHPKSRGSIEISNTDPLSNPIIHTGYLSDKEDIDTLLKGIRKLKNIKNSTYLKSVGSFIAEVDLPQCKMFEFNSDEYWRCYILNMASTIYDTAGTCAMGKVVDGNLKVYGINKLRVVDASVLPTLTSGNINAPVMMIAEKASDLIKNHNKYKKVNNDIKKIYFK